MSPEPDATRTDQEWIEAMRSVLFGYSDWHRLGYDFFQEFHIPVRARTGWQVRARWQSRVPPEIIEEGIQQGFQNFFDKGVHAYDGSSALLTYLTTLCTNATTDILGREGTQKKLKKKKEKEPDLGAGTEIVMDEEMTDLLDEFCATLPKDDARIFSLRHKEGKTLKEISKIFRVCIATVHNRLENSKEQFKRWLLDRLHGPDDSASGPTPSV